VTTGRDRLASLDVVRGAAVAGMILVNNPGNWNSTFEWLTHANWSGCTFADLVFPFFIFILGAAMPLAFTRRASAGRPRRELYIRVARRSLWLILLGLMLNVVASTPPIIALRLPGVLQRIGLVYLIAAPIVMHANPWRRTAVIGMLVLVHWALLIVPTLDASAALSQTQNISAMIDRAVFGRHLLAATGDPEGLLGTMPAVGTALMGSIAGNWLAEVRPLRIRVAGLVGGGLGAVVVGLGWASLLPLNKSLWTGSFVLFTGGIATLTLAIVYVLYDVCHYRRWAEPFIWLGFNPLVIYFLAELIAHLMDAPWGAAGGRMTVRTWIFWDVLSRLAPAVAPEWLSLAFALAIVAMWMSVASVLYHRGVRVQV
jgi:predicted acyltransferase